MKNKKIFSPVITAALLIIGSLILSISRDPLIIENGILFYRRIRISVLSVLSALFIISFFIYLFSLFKDRKIKKESIKKEEEEKEAEKKEKEEGQILSVNKKMDNATLRNLLRKHDCLAYREEINAICIELESMDRQQEKLTKLLESNGADSLKNSEDVLDKVEQHMCKSVRKVINYMDIAEKGDEEMIKEKLSVCLSECRTHISQVKDFLFALADFLNTQGDGDNSMEMLDMYKETILESLK